MSISTHAKWLAAQQYPSRSQDCAWHRRAMDELAPLVKLTQSHHAVELGSGEPESYGVTMLKAAGLSVVTVDMGADADVRADIQALPFADKSFDLALARHSLEHCVAPLIALREARRVARWLIAVVPEYNLEWLYWLGHFSIFPRETWEHLFRLAGWQIRYFGLGDFSWTHNGRDIEWRYVLEKGPEYNPPREENGCNLGTRYPLARQGWQEL